MPAFQSMRRFLLHFRVALWRAFQHDAFAVAKGAAFSAIFTLFPAVLLAASILSESHTTVMSNADDDTTHDSTAYRVYASENDSGESQQRNVTESGIYGYGGKKDPTDCRNGSGNTPGYCIDGTNIDTHRQRRLDRKSVV